MICWLKVVWPLGQRRRRCPNSKPALSQRLTFAETWDVGSTLVYCWAHVVDGGPTVNQRWANVSCLLGWRLTRLYQSEHNTVLQCWVNVGPASFNILRLMGWGSYRLTSCLVAAFPWGGGVLILCTVHSYCSDLLYVSGVRTSNYIFLHLHITTRPSRIT